MLVGALLASAAATFLGVLIGSTLGMTIAFFTVGLGASTGKIAFDSLLQRDGPDAVRGRAFAQFETRFQAAWVVGALLGIIPVAIVGGLTVLGARPRLRRSLVPRRAAVRPHPAVPLEAAPRGGGPGPRPGPRQPQEPPPPDQSRAAQGRRGGPPEPPGPRAGRPRPAPLGLERRAPPRPPARRRRRPRRPGAPPSGLDPLAPPGGPPAAPPPLGLSPSPIRGADPARRVRPSPLWTSPSARSTPPSCPPSRGSPRSGSPEPSTWLDQHPAWGALDVDRTLAGFEGDELVATSRNYSLELTVPGGASLPAAGVSAVTVRPTHRRRGVLRQMMRGLLDEAAGRGEPVAMLTASEGRDLRAVRVRRHHPHHGDRARPARRRVHLAPTRGAAADPRARRGRQARTRGLRPGAGRVPRRGVPSRRLVGRRAVGASLRRPLRRRLRDASTGASTATPATGSASASTPAPPTRSPCATSSPPPRPPCTPSGGTCARSTWSAPSPTPARRSTSPCRGC